MSDILMIVEKLNAPPFNKGFTLVSFDERKPIELLQLVNDVFTELDKSHHNNVKVEPEEVMGNRMIGFLQILKYPFPKIPIEEFTRSFLSGDRHIIISVLSFLFSRFDQHKKRAYVAKYLLPLEIPPEYAHDPTISDLLNRYRDQQLQFKETHKALEKARTLAGSKASPPELRKEVQQLEDEKSQLNEKISNLKKKTADIKGFQVLLEATSSLRREQEEEGKLREKIAEQKQLLYAAETTYNENNRNLAELRASLRSDLSAQAIFDSAVKERESLLDLVQNVFPSNFKNREILRKRLKAELEKPSKTIDQLHELEDKVNDLENVVSRLQASVNTQQAERSDPKLGLFFQQSNLIKSKLRQRTEELQEAKNELSTQEREVEHLKSQLSELQGPQYMKKSEFEAYAQQLRRKGVEFKEKRAEMEQLKAETQRLLQEEQSFRESAGEEGIRFLEQLENLKGSNSAGASSSREQIRTLKNMVESKRLLELRDKLDSMSTSTKAELTRVAEEIEVLTEAKRSTLTPQIQHLRKLRFQFVELEREWLHSKLTYEGIGESLKAGREKYERLAAAAFDEYCRSVQQICLLKGNIELINARRAVLDEFQQNSNGNGRYMRDFATLVDFYNTKTLQLDSMIKQLRRKQNDLKENATQRIKQKTLFESTKKILEWKLEHLKKSLEENMEEDARIHFTARHSGVADVMTV